MGGNRGELGNPMEMEPAMGGDMAAPDFGGMMGLGAKGKRRKGALTRPGEGIRPSEILNHIGWTIWGFSWLATTNAIRFVTYALLVFLLGLVSLELPALGVNLIALALGGVAAWFIQIRITALERPMFIGHFSLSAGLALVLDLSLNYAGAKFAAPVLAKVFNWNVSTFYMVLGAIGLTVLAEAFMTWALIERRKGF